MSSGHWDAAISVRFILNIFSQEDRIVNILLCYILTFPINATVSPPTAIYPSAINAINTQYWKEDTFHKMSTFLDQMICIFVCE